MLGQPHLRDVALTRMDELKSKDASFYDDPSEPIVLFPFLVSLKLFALPNLEGWKETKEVLELTTLPDSLFQINNYLAELSIKDCPILTHVVPNKSLRSLEIYRRPKLTYLPEGLNSLRDLKIEDCEGLTFLPSGALNSFTSLKNLTIKNCSKLVSLPELQQLHCSLSFLEVICCNKLSSLPEDLGYLTRINTLRIGPFSKELDSFPSLNGIQNLRSSLIRVELFGHQHWES
ncbi:hypothetical protein LguiB_009489 [Lonicera macranthoides]